MHVPFRPLNPGSLGWATTVAWAAGVSYLCTHGPESSSKSDSVSRTVGARWSHLKTFWLELSVSVSQSVVLIKFQRCQPGSGPVNCTQMR